MSPPAQPPALCGAVARSGVLLGRDACRPPRSRPLLEPAGRKERESRWCLQRGHPVLVPFPQKLEAPVPPPQALCSLPHLSVFIDPASWRFSIWLPLDLLLPVSGDGEKSQDVWVSLWRTDQTRYSAAAWGKSEGEEESWFCRVP